jgi:UDP-N-acetylglucosamine/UDP-N-acetylgalactosamine 4-epimerase
MNGINESRLNFVRNTRFLITGGAGFIGSNIAHRLVEYGAKHVRIIDNLSTGYLSNLSSLIVKGKIEFIEGDICNPEICDRACEGMDVVLHHAALGSVPRSIANPAATNAANISGFVNMLFAAQSQKVKRFVYASSSSVYGDDTTMPKQENRTGNLLSPYAVTKRANEEYARVFAQVYGLQTVGLRYFNVFGPHQSVNGPYAAVIPLFIHAVVKNESPTIFGDGETTRDFTFVDNVVLANIGAAASEKITTNSPVINIAFGSTVSLNELYRSIAAISGSSLQPYYGPERKGDIKNSWADISRAKNLLDYEPQIGLQEGLKKTVAWFRSSNS